MQWNLGIIHPGLRYAPSRLRSLHQSPRQFERLNTAVRNWSQELIVTYLHCYHGISVTRQAVAANLKRHGIRLNRGRLKVTAPDPLYTIKREQLNALKKKPNRARSIYF